MVYMKEYFGKIPRKSRKRGWQKYNSDAIFIEKYKLNNNIFLFL